MSVVIYIHSSFLRAILLEENNKEEYVLTWKNATHRLSSILLKAECIVTLRRSYRSLTKNLPLQWLQTKETKLKNLLDEVSLKIIDRTIIGHIRNKPELSECRTLDALHLSTVLEFSKNSPESIKICSLDKSMRMLSKKLGFPVFPKDEESEL